MDQMWFTGHPVTDFFLVGVGLVFINALLWRWLSRSTHSTLRVIDEKKREIVLVRYIVTRPEGSSHPVTSRYQDIRGMTRPVENMRVMLPVNNAKVRAKVTDAFQNVDDQLPFDIIPKMTVYVTPDDPEDYDTFDKDSRWHVLRRSA